jgi:hypothetical protein
MPDTMQAASLPSVCQLRVVGARRQSADPAAVAIRQLTAVQQVLSGSANVADKHLQPDAVRTVTAGDGLGLASQLEPGDLTKWLGEPDLTPWRRPDPA